MVVNPPLVALEVAVDHESHRQRPVLHKGLQHELLVAGSIVPSHVLIVFDVGAAAAGVSFARVIL